jgi:hypothetical protein
MAKINWRNIVASLAMFGHRHRVGGIGKYRAPYRDNGIAALRNVRVAALIIAMRRHSAAVCASAPNARRNILHCFSRNKDTPLISAAAASWRARSRASARQYEIAVSRRLSAASAAANQWRS